ncbi:MULTISPECIES: helicase HerA-like domain-containing protein [Citricoccus]|uniref:helicase HerA-like domain-containing protein n=1 Tax=Citricoccus TaxID=169133 RepID=UPI000255F5F5|nr:helicase HerA-like domain-containing protein [Citricoccus sp. CH26A]
MTDQQSSPPATSSQQTPSGPASGASSTLLETIRAGYRTEGDAITLGAAVVDDVVHADAPVRLPLAMMNRHGLVAGATGTGKTVTLQVMAEQLSAAGVPVFLADVKGDLSGLATAATPSDRLAERTAATGMPWQPAAFPVEFLALGGDGPGIPVRATVDSFGPLLLARIMDLNETQESCLQLMFHWADERELPLDDLKDLRAVVMHLTSKEGKEDLRGLGGVATSTANVILREVTALAAGGMDAFFGVPEFETAELLRRAPDSRGVISCLELPSLQQRPRVFSTFMVWLLADLFAELPEVGDTDRPKLVFFLDEAHLVFDDASDAFLDAITTTVRLIRSKGVGIFFVTQSPQDVPEEVLGQLANRVQHALRAFTPKDARALRQAVQTFPHTEYDLEEVLTSAGTGEAVVTVMDEDGAPTPVALTRMWSPTSVIGPSTPEVLDAAVAASALLEAYGQDQDRVSAFERLTGSATAEPDADAARPVPTGGSVGSHTPGAGQSQADIDAEARRIEAEILGHPVPSSGPVEAPRDEPAPRRAPTPPPRREPAPARSRREENPMAEVVEDIARTAATAFGRSVVRSVFGTKRRGRRRGGLFG